MAQVENVYVPLYVHQLIARELEEMEVGVLEDLEEAVANSVPRNVGKNLMVLYSVTPKEAGAVFNHLSEIILENDVNGHTLMTCEKVLDKFKVVMDKFYDLPEEPVANEAVSTYMEIPKKKKKSPGKKAGGHIPAIWRDWDDERLLRHLRNNVYISDRAWTRDGEARLKGESRSDFIDRIFAVRINFSKEV